LIDFENFELNIENYFFNICVFVFLISTWLLCCRRRSSCFLWSSRSERM